MRLTIFLSVFTLLHFVTSAQGITLLYKGGSDGGWNDAANWIQLNAPSRQAPAQRVPTELDDVVFSKSMSGLSSTSFGLELSDSLEIGGNRANGFRCRSMRISNMEVNFGFRNNSPGYSPTLHVFDVQWWSASN